MMDRRQALGLTLPGLAALAVSPSKAFAHRDAVQNVLLWPGAAPGGEGVTVTPEVIERSTDPAYHDRIAKHTRDPLITVVYPQLPNGTSILLIPGGGYRWAVVDKEGMDCAAAFAALGYTCFVLRYRLPADGWAAGPDAPLQDAQRALRFVRLLAKAYGLPPDRVVALGASAGGHLTGLLGSRQEPAYAPMDRVDDYSHRPDALVLLYPVVTLADPYAHAGSRRELLGEAHTPDQITAYSLEQQDWSGAAPTFLLHAMDDAPVPVENSLLLTSTLRAAGVPVETHLFEEGGHGFGIRLIAGKPAEAWPQLVARWLSRHGL